MLEKLSLELLNKIYNSKFEYVIILLNGEFIETDEDEIFKQYENSNLLEFVIFTSDMETMFEIKNEIERR